MNKKNIIMLVIVVVVIAIFALIIGNKFGPMFTMHPLHSGVINEQDADCQIRAFKLGNHDLFFISDDDKYVVVDTGINAKPVSLFMKKHEIKPEDVSAVLLTHHHFDHVNGLPAFGDATVYIGAEDAGQISAKNICEVTNDEILHTTKHEIKCIALPGHTAGSVGYLVDNKYLFIGDAAKIDDGKFDIHPYTTDEAIALTSIEKIKQYYQNGITVISAHYGLINGKK